MARTYERTHPWITFTVDPHEFSRTTWLLLGEAESKCQHVAGVPLRPAVARRLHLDYLSKGVHGTTSIEGNTLSEAEVLMRVKGDLDLPPSRQYLGQEVDNILAACNDIVDDVVGRRPLELTVERLEHFNAQVLEGLDLGEDVIPGKIRTTSVGLTERGGPIPVAKLPELSARVAVGYANRGLKTVTRDVNELVRAGLVRRVRGGLVANMDLIRAFLPLRAEADVA